MTENREQGEDKSNFNREIDQLLVRAEQRVRELRQLNRTFIYPWEKQEIDRRLKQLENDEVWDKKRIESRLESLEERVRSLLIFFTIILFLVIIFVSICLLAFGKFVIS
jgi:hypothetical protein